MGIIISKLRKKKSTYEILENLDTRIRTIEEFRRSTEQTHKKIVGRFILISVFVYLITAFIFYFYFFPASMYERLIYVVPLLSAPLVILVVKRLLTWYYNRKLRKNQLKLASLREEKKKMLNNVMETETYKVAKTILDKFAPEQVRKTSFDSPSNPIVPVSQSSSLLSSQLGLRYRGGYGQPLSLTPRPSYASPYAQGSSFAKGPLMQSRLSLPAPTLAVVPAPTPAPADPLSALVRSQLPQSAVKRQDGVMNVSPVRLPRGILPRERTVLDKMVDYLVGDGPSNRYALICRDCSSHNGMALKEEFEYLSFRCCYCQSMNPARKQRPVGPKLETEAEALSKKLSFSSGSEDSSSSDSDLEKTNNRPTRITVAAISSGSESCETPDVKASDAEETIAEIHNSREEKEATEVEVIEGKIVEPFEEQESRVVEPLIEEPVEESNTEEIGSRIVEEKMLRDSNAPSEIEPSTVSGLLEDGSENVQREISED